MTNIRIQYVEHKVKLLPTVWKSIKLYFWETIREIYKGRKQKTLTLKDLVLVDTITELLQTVVVLTISLQPDYSGR